MTPNEFDPNSPEFIEYKKKLSDHNWEGHVASNKRFDYLLVTVCGAGIYLVLEALKYMNDKGLEVPYFLKYSGVIFLIAIIFNFFGQFCTFNVFSNLLLIEQLEVFKRFDDVERLERRVKTYYRHSVACMFVSVITMLSALSILVVVLCTTF